MYVCMYVCRYEYIYIISICMHTFIHTYIHIYIYTYTYMHIWYMYHKPDIHSYKWPQRWKSYFSLSTTRWDMKNTTIPFPFHAYYWLSSSTTNLVISYWLLTPISSPINTGIMNGPHHSRNKNWWSNYVRVSLCWGLLQNVFPPVVKRGNGKSALYRWLSY